MKFTIAEVGFIHLYLVAFFYSKGVVCSYGFVYHKTILKGTKKEVTIIAAINMSAAISMRERVIDFIVEVLDC